MYHSRCCCSLLLLLLLATAAARCSLLLAAARCCSLLLAAAVVEVCCLLLLLVAAVDGVGVSIYQIVSHAINGQREFASINSYWRQSPLSKLAAVMPVQAHFTVLTRASKTSTGNLALLPLVLLYLNVYFIHPCQPHVRRQLYTASTPR